MVDYALVQLYTSKGDSKGQELMSLLKEEKFWTEYDNLVEMKIEKLTDKSVLAYYYQSLGKDKEALEKWRDIGKSRVQRPVAVKETLDLLARWLQPEDSQMRSYGEVQDMLRSFLAWVLDCEPEQGLSLFRRVKNYNLLEPSAIKKYLQEQFGA